MADFAASVTDRRLRDRLEMALRGPGAFRRFKDVLDARPVERERWFAFHDARVREAMLEGWRTTTSSRLPRHRSGKYEGGSTMTVAQLIEILRGFPPDLPVILEGCDCVGDASGVTIKGGQALVTRPDGVYSAAANGGRDPIERKP